MGFDATIQSLLRMDESLIYFHLVFVVVATCSSGEWGNGYGDGNLNGAFSLDTSSYKHVYKA